MIAGSEPLFAQATFVGHFSNLTPAVDWCGWDGASTIASFDLRTVTAIPINFQTANTQRMTIMGTNNITNWGNNTGYVGIGNTQPLSLLHLGNVNCYNGNFCAGGTVPAAGWRPWMITGTFLCGVPGVTSSDHMYVGLKNETGPNDRDDAVIVWGDNIGTDGGAPGPDNFRFIFTEYCNEAGADPTASGLSGLEVMRLAPYMENGNFISINAGIGNYNNNPYIPPQRRLEVLDMAKDRPQFRITYTQNANLHNAIFTDFQTTQNGDLNIRGFSTGNPVANGKPGTSTNRGRVGFNLPLNTDPSNTVEINSGISSVAGLRFTQLAGTPILGGNNGKVLTVDANGDVIFVPEGSANVSVCSALSGQLNYISKWTNNTLPGEICQTNIYEAEPSNNVGIDYNGYAVTAKLNVNFTTSPAATVGIQSVAVSGAGVPVAVYGFSTGTSGTSNWIGVKGEAAGSVNNFENVGVWGIGGPGFTSTNNGNYSYGVWGLAQCQAAVGKNWGVYGQAIYGPSGNNHGVHGRVAGANDWAGWFDGNVFSTGTYQGSDSILKTNVNEIQDALNGIMALKPKTYLLDTAAFSQMNLPPEEQFGLIAQELEDVYPTLVRYAYISPEYDTVGNMISEEMKLKAINYTGLIPILISAIQELNGRVDALEAQLTDCCTQKQLRPSGSNEEHATDQLDIELYNATAIILDQNSPNPFAENTLISWFIPAEVQQARLIFFDGQGRILKTVEINERGNGELRVYASNLSDGTYSYSLLADNKVIDTKRMVKQH